MLVTLLALWFLPRTYRSESQLYIRPGRETATLDPTATIGRPLAPSSLLSLRENEVNSVTEILQNRVLLERVVDLVGSQAILLSTDPVGDDPDQTGDAASAPRTRGQSDLKHSTKTASVVLDTDWPRKPSDRDRAISKLQDMLKVGPVKKSDVVSVSCVSGSPRLSQKVVANLVEFYLDEHLRLNRTPGAREFLERQTDQMREKLTRASETLRGLQDKTGLASPDVQRDMMVNRAGRLEDELNTTAADLASTEAEVKLLRERLATVPKTTVNSSTAGIANHGAELMRNELYRLEILEHELSSKYTDEHFLVQQARERVAAAKKLFDAEKETRDTVTSGTNSVFEQTQLALVKQEPLLNSLRAKTEALRSQLAEVREGIKAFNADMMQIAELTRELKRYETDYEAYAQHLEQTRIDEALEVGRISSINIIQPATFEAQPVGPKTVIVAFAGVVIGLVGAFGLPLAAESLALPLKTSQDVENHLGVPVLASIPRFRPDQLSGNGGAS